MSDIPPFAKVLKERSSAGSTPKKERKTISAHSSPKKDVFSKTFFSKSSKDDEIRYLKEENARLRETIETQNQNFESLQRSFTIVQQQLNEERELSQKSLKVLVELRSSLSVEQEKSGTLMEQINQLDNFLKTRQIVNESRKMMAERLQKEYEVLLNDYHQTIDNFTSQSKELRETRIKVKELEDQLQEFNKSHSPITPRGFAETAPLRIDIPAKDSFGFDDFEDQFQEEKQEENSFARSYPVPNMEPFDQSVPKRLTSVSVGDYSPLRTPTKNQAPFAVGSGETKFERLSPQKSMHPAMNDSISFGDDDKDDEQMNQQFFNDDNIEEMKKELSQLLAQKDFIESMLNAPPPKTISLAQSRNEKKQWEEKFDTIMKQISSLRLRLKRLREL